MKVTQYIKSALPIMACLIWACANGCNAASLLDSNLRGDTERVPANNKETTPSVALQGMELIDGKSRILQDDTTCFGSREDLDEAIALGNFVDGTFGPIADWCFEAAVDDFEKLFEDNILFDEDISAWDVSFVTDMTGMFFGAKTFNQDLSSWSTAAVTSIKQMFQKAFVFNGDLSSWETSAVIDMESLFFQAREFNGDLSNWDTSAVANMKRVFQDTRVFNGDLSNWNTAAVTIMESMFQDARAFNGDLSSWDTAAVTNMEEMFMGTRVFNQNLCIFGDSSALVTVNNMFLGASGCPTELDPDLNASPAGPFCQDCAPTVSPTESLTESPSQSPTVPATESPTEPDVGLPTEPPAEPPAPSPAPAPAPAEDGGGCFSEDVTAQVRDKGTVSMKNLRIGDQVLTGDGGYQSIYAFGHLAPNVKAEFLKLTTSEGKNLEVTPEHLLFLHGKSDPVRADHISVGDILQCGNFCSGTKVTAVLSVRKRGLYAPFTVGGTVMVEGVKASCYIWTGSTPVSQHKLAHVTLAPFRLLCSSASFGFCHDYTEKGMPQFVDSGLQLASWFDSFEANQMVKMALLVLHLLSLGVFMVAEFMLGSSLIHLGVVGAIIWLRATGGAGFNMRKVKQL